MKKLISIFLCMILIISSSISAIAAENVLDSEKSRIVTSDTGYMQITFNTQKTREGIKKNDANNSKEIKSFVIEQFENNELIQTVEGVPGGEELVVTDYQDGIVINTETRMVSDIIEKIEPETGDESKNMMRASGYEKIGYITYKPTTGASSGHKISVHSKYNGYDNPGFKIHGDAADTLAVITGAIAGVLSEFITSTTIYGKIAKAIVSSFGGSIAGGAIGVTFTELVSVDEYSYTLKGYDFSTDRYTTTCDGFARRVKTESSKYYGEWIYENFTPDNWKDNTLAYWFWCDLFGDPYPKVASYKDV